jgi:integrase/recombinase XerD
MKSFIFKSIFARHLTDFLHYKRSLGFKYETEERLLKRLDKFFIEKDFVDLEIRKGRCKDWYALTPYNSIKTQAAKHGVLKAFCVYLNNIGVPAYVPQETFKKNPKYDAHIYTNTELKALFAVIDKSQSVESECPYRGIMMPIFFRILYTSGLRVSELRLLRIKDFDLEKSVITVRSGKNNKDRLVPVHPLLSQKSKGIKDAVHLTSSEDEFFFMIKPGKPMSLQNIYKNFRRYLEKAGISHTGRGPRVHDFRHTFCVNLLHKWTVQKQDLEAMLPYLRTILGHESFKETAYYLKLTEEHFPEIRDQLQKCFPNIVKELDDEELG